MAQRFRVEPAWGLGGASAGKGTGTGGEAAGGRSLLPARSVEGEAAARQGAGAGHGGATSTVVSTEKWDGAIALRPGMGTLVSTEKWDGAAALAGMAGGERFAKTEPWEQARDGARAMTAGAVSSRTRWALVVIGVLVLGLTALIAAVVVARLAKG
ncbi:hypothetical protein [Sorangium sp. So ce1182]|uniref:hypothetical protein n=1 Tax=Sorangium sp. So ce1182 TaxID=3133334 RepID=UPI003F6231E9